MSENDPVHVQDEALHRAYCAMLLAGRNAGANGAGGSATLSSVETERLQQAPHVPDEPSEDQVLRLIEHLAYSLSYLVVKEVRGGWRTSRREELAFTPVLGICWQHPNPDTVTVEIKGKPYLIPTQWLPATMQAQLTGR